MSQVQRFHSLGISVFTRPRPKAEIHDRLLSGGGGAYADRIRTRVNGPTVAIHWTSVEHGVLFTNSSGVFYGQKMADPFL
jgi:hypothetical protein